MVKKMAVFCLIHSLFAQAMNQETAMGSMVHTTEQCVAEMDNQKQIFLKQGKGSKNNINKGRFSFKDETHIESIDYWGEQESVPSIKEIRRAEYEKDKLVKSQKSKIGDIIKRYSFIPPGEFTSFETLMRYKGHKSFEPNDDITAKDVQDFMRLMVPLFVEKNKIGYWRPEYREYAWVPLEDIPSAILWKMAIDYDTLSGNMDFKGDDLFEKDEDLTRNKKLWEIIKEVKARLYKNDQKRNKKEAGLVGSVTTLDEKSAPFEHEDHSFADEYDAVKADLERQYYRKYHYKKQ